VRLGAQDGKRKIFFLRELEGQKAPTEILLKQIKIQNTRYTKHRKEEERGKRESLRDKEKEKQQRQGDYNRFSIHCSKTTETDGLALCRRSNSSLQKKLLED
jgi:hypothetical protein